MGEQPMKIACYNILDGGLGRLDPIYETLLYLNADVVGLCEADDPKGVRYLADKLSMDYVVAEGTERRGVAMLSRRPIEEMWSLSAKHPILDKGGLLGVVSTEDGPLQIALVHLEAGQDRSNEDSRLRQVEAVLGELASPTMDSILMGDLNAAAPYHPFDYEAASPKVKRRLALRDRRELDHDVVGRIASAGWLDAYHTARPKDARHTYTTGFPATRFDYIWLSPGLASRLGNSDVEQGGFAPYCSDHYPIWASLRSGPPRMENMS
jgi:endonuclease/exonuclease/phosphatase family metal-dependent hydrolase